MPGVMVKSSNGLVSCALYTCRRESTEQVHDCTVSCQRSAGEKMLHVEMHFIFVPTCFLGG